MNYQELLKRAKQNLPVMDTASRFVMPEAVIFSTKKLTRIKNFTEIAKAVRRAPEHIAKFLFKELACSGAIEGDELVFQGRIGRNIINSRINSYVSEFVLCKECNRPDTNMHKEDRLVTIKCEACGAKRTVKNR